MYRSRNDTRPDQLLPWRRQLCSYSHPVLDELREAGENVPHFNSLATMRRYIREKRHLNFCDICLKGRKVGHLQRSGAEAVQ